MTGRLPLFRARAVNDGHLTRRATTSLVLVSEVEEEFFLAMPGGGLRLLFSAWLLGPLLPGGS